MRTLFTIMIILTAAAAFAGGIQKDGLSGYADIGVIGVSSNDALMTSENNRNISTLSDSPDRFGKAMAAVIFNVNYKKDSLIYHAGSPLENVRPQFELGVKKLFNGSSIDTSLVIDPMGSVWEDPYVSRRKKTGKLSAGIKMKYSNIAGTPHFMQFQIMRHDVDTDKIGERYSSMKRDGYTAELRCGYRFQLPAGSLKPFIILERDSREGDAQSYKGAGAGMMYQQKVKSGVIISAVKAEYMSYDKTNPIFDKTRKDIKAAAFVNYRWMNPLGFKGKHISFMGGVADRSSNTDFYNAVTWFGGVTLGVDF